MPDALFEGLQWDCEGRRYEDLEALHAYAARVAGAVGVMMALLMGVRDADALARACDLGVAMQLTNIARDVGEDARAGRLYLPLDWLREAGLDPAAFLADACAERGARRALLRVCWRRRTGSTLAPREGVARLAARPAVRPCSRRRRSMPRSGARWRGAVAIR